MPRLEIIEVIIHPNRQTDDNESDLAFRRVQLGLEYCGFIFRSIGSMRAANEPNIIRECLLATAEVKTEIAWQSINQAREARAND